MPGLVFYLVQVVHLWPLCSLTVLPPPLVNCYSQGLPRPETVRTFRGVAGTMVAHTSVAMTAYFAMSVAATSMGLVATAAHQIAMQTFWFVSFFPEPLSMAAQTLIARERGHPAAARSWAALLFRSGLVLGLGLAGVVAGAFTFGAGTFTADPTVLAAVRQLAPLGAAATVVVSVMMMFDGISIGAGTLRHMPVGAAAGLAACVGVLWAGARAGAGLQAVWWALCAFYVVRTSVHSAFYVLTWPSNVFGGGRRLKEEADARQALGGSEGGAAAAAG